MALSRWIALPFLILLQVSSLNAGTMETDKYGFKINGEYTFLRGGTLQWFRIPEPEWDDRLEKFKRAGFNTIDIYVPWNLIEPESGQFNFDNPNLVNFLEIAHEKGLYIYFRPGPYITNEMDSGGIPHWMLQNTTKKGRADDGLVLLRDNDPDFLFYVERYFKKLNEVIEPYLITNGGPIILYALENEYNYFENSTTIEKSFNLNGEPERPINYSTDTRGYFESMKTIVQGQGIDVPLATCPGSRIQGTGNTPGIIPMPNLYQGDKIDKYMYEDITTMHMADRYDGAYVDSPSGITEADRTSSRLKRIFMSGMDAAFLFNISGGIAPGYGNAIGTWGFDFNKLLRNPKSNDFTSIGYFPNTIDFYGPISTSGGLRDKFYGMRRANLFFDTFENKLAPLLYPERSGTLDSGEPSNGEVVVSHPFIGAQQERGRVHYWHKDNDGAYYVQLLNETGKLQVIPREKLQIGQWSIPKYTRLEVPPEDFPSHYWLDVNDDVINSMILLANHKIHDKLTLNYTTSETLHLGNIGSDRLLVLYGKTGTQGETSFKFDGSFDIKNHAARVYSEGDDVKTLVYNYKAKPQLITFNHGDVKTRILILDKLMAGRTWFENIQGESIIFMGPDYLETSQNGLGVDFHWREGVERTVYTLSDEHLSLADLESVEISRKPSIIDILQAHRDNSEDNFPEVDHELNFGLSTSDYNEASQLKTSGREWIEYEGQPRPLEDFKLAKGHSWYQTTFQIDSIRGLEEAPLYIAHGSDFVGIYINGNYLTTLAPLGTEILSNHASPNYSFTDLAPYLKKGQNLLSFRTEVWGHGSFMFPRGKFRYSDSQVPAVSFDSKKRLYGEAFVTLNRNGSSEKIDLNNWAVSQHSTGELLGYQDANHDTSAWNIQELPTKLKRGQVLWYQSSFSTKDLPDSDKLFAPVALKLEGRFAKATIYLNGKLVGRWLSGREWLRRGTWMLPTRDLWARINPDQIPILWGDLNEDSNTLSVIVEDTSDLNDDEGEFRGMSLIYNQEKWGAPYEAYSNDNILRTSIRKSEVKL